VPSKASSCDAFDDGFDDAESMPRGLITMLRAFAWAMIAPFVDGHASQQTAAKPSASR